MQKYDLVTLICNCAIFSVVHFKCHLFQGCICSEWERFANDNWIQTCTTCTDNTKFPVYTNNAKYHKKMDSSGRKYVAINVALFFLFIPLTFGNYFADSCDVMFDSTTVPVRSLAKKQLLSASSVFAFSTEIGSYLSIYLSYLFISSAPPFMSPCFLSTMKKTLTNNLKQRSSPLLW